MRHYKIITLSIFGLGLLMQGPNALAAVTAPGEGGQKLAQEGQALAANVRLDDLFQRLQKAPNEASGRSIEVDIWEHWSKSGVPGVDGLMSQARVLVSKGYLEPSLGLLDRVVYEKPDFIDGWNRRATVLFLMKRDKESLVDIAKVLALEPRHFGALAGKVIIKMRMEQWQQALIALRKAVAIHPFLRERHLIPVLEQKLKLRKL